MTLQEGRLLRLEAAMGNIINQWRYTNTRMGDSDATGTCFARLPMLRQDHMRK